MSDGSKPVDEGFTHVPMTFAFNVDGMKVGESRNLHAHPDCFKIMAGVSNLELANIHNATITSSANGGIFGVSAFHTVKPPTEKGGDEKSVYLNLAGAHGLLLDSIPEKQASEHNLYTPAQKASAHSAHHITTPNMATASKEMPVIHSTAYSSNSAATPPEEARLRLIKKLTTKWTGFTPANVAVGVTHAMLDDDERYVIRAEKEGEPPSAIHRLLTMSGPKMFKGKYVTDKYRSLGPDGKHVYEMEPQDFHDVRKKLNSILNTTSDFKDGIGVKITKLAESAHVDNPADKQLVVGLHFTRTPFDPVDGFKSVKPHPIVTQSHIDSLEGASGAEVMSRPVRDGAMVNAFAEKLKNEPGAAKRIVLKTYSNNDEDEMDTVSMKSTVDT